MFVAMNNDELYNIVGRTFVLRPESTPINDDTAWTYLELINNKTVDPEGMIKCSASKSFIKFHIRSHFFRN